LTFILHGVTMMNVSTCVEIAEAIHTGVRTGRGSLGSRDVPGFIPAVLFEIELEHQRRVKPASGHFCLRMKPHSSFGRKVLESNQDLGRSPAYKAGPSTGLSPSVSTIWGGCPVLSGSAGAPTQRSRLINCSRHMAVARNTHLDNDLRATGLQTKVLRTSILTGSPVRAITEGAYQATIQLVAR
jgi:hypothetical protein